MTPSPVPLVLANPEGFGKEKAHLVISRYRDNRHNIWDLKIVESKLWVTEDVNLGHTWATEFVAF